MREIAEDAGLTVPAVYYHFAAMDELYAAVVREGRTRFRGMLAAAVSEPGDADARLCAVGRVFIGFGREDPIRLRLLAAHLFGPRDAGYPDREDVELQTWIEVTVSPLVAEATATDGERTRTNVQLFVALLNGLLVEQARAPEAPMLDDALADRAVTVFLRGARSALV